MRKIGALLLVLLLCLTACAPAASEQEPPESQGEQSEPVVLTLAGFGITESPMRAIVNAFNEANSAYQVELIDYGADSESIEQGRQQLNTQLLAGAGPDMIQFYDTESKPGTVSPLPYISKGLLLDMDGLLEADPEIAQEDIVVWNALHQYGGLYLMAPQFEILSVLCLTETFGERTGWTIDEYLELDASLEDWQDVIYYMTPENFLDRIGAPYIRDALDLESGSCDFESEGFVKILDAAYSAKICDPSEYETPDNLVLASQRMVEGQLLTCLNLTDLAWDMAADQWEFQDHELTYIGFPTLDGSCGSTVILDGAVGICARTEHPEGCWAFIKFMLSQPVMIPGIPIYLPELEKAVEEHNQTETNWYMDETLMKKLLDLAGACNQLAYYDENLLNIILEEASAIGTGTATAEEAAHQIQTRASLYVQERYG